MSPGAANPVVHLELHTANLSRACGFYTRLFGWRAERIAVGRSSYVALELSDRVDGGVVERDSDRCLWLPYVEVADVVAGTERACRLGASVLLDPRERPRGVAKHRRRACGGGDRLVAAEGRLVGRDGSRRPRASIAVRSAATDL